MTFINRKNMERILVEKTKDYTGETVKIAGWIHNRRDHGKIIFLDIRDRSGILQTVVVPGNDEVYEKAKTLRNEFVVEIEGLIKERPQSAKNEEISTGLVEMEVSSIKVLNESKTTPFEINKDSKEVGDEARLKYRYLDLRTERMQKNLLMRSQVFSFIRNYFIKESFVEIETPVLTKGTPEGAREYLVPSRIHKGKFYVLPQSPQQFKQLLMVSGIEKYFQIVKCFRDEDQRGDRQPEFTQLDVEMSFTDQDQVRNLIEKCMVELVNENYPEKKVSENPFPVLTYKEAMEKYNSDKPDLRKNKNDSNELAFCWVKDFPMFEKNDEGELGAVHHPFTLPYEEDLGILKSDPEKVRAKAYDLVLNGYEIGGGSMRIHKKDIQQKVFEALGIDEQTIQKRFGHMLEAFEYGAPPHGGIALGLDRLVMVLQDEPNIREVMAFPKTGEAEDLMIQAPNEIDSKQLAEVGIKMPKKSKMKGKGKV